MCVSDTHNQTVKLPKGDVLIHAGDLTNQGSFSEVCRCSSAGTQSHSPCRQDLTCCSFQRLYNGWRRLISRPR